MSITDKNKIEIIQKVTSILLSINPEYKYNEGIKFLMDLSCTLNKYGGYDNA